MDKVLKLVDDVNEKVEKVTPLFDTIGMVSDKVNVAATAAARDDEVTEEIKAYRANKHTYSDEDVAEMRAAFGAGTTVVNVLSGEKICL